MTLLALQTFVEALESRICLAAPTQWTSRGPGGGGAFFAPSFSPFNSSELYVASDMSGVYHSTNTGASWQILPFGQLQGGRGARVQFTSNPSILYSLDYTEFANGVDSQTPKESADGGATWTNLAGWDSSDTTYSVFADPNSTTNLIVSDYDTIYFSSNSGATFTAKYTAPSDGSGAFVAGALFDGSNIYVATNRGLLVSNNGGASFAIQSLGGMTGVMFSFAGAKQGSTTRFFAVTLPFGDVFPGMDIESSNTDYEGIYSIDVGQTSWTAKTTGIPAGDFPSFISMARNDINTAYVAGGGAADAPTVSKTTNAGASWSPVLNTTNNGNVATGWQGAGGDRGWSFGEYALDFEVDPTDSSHVAFTDLGYVHLTANGGTSWQQAYVNPADQNPAGSNITQHKAYRGVGLEDTSAHWLYWLDANNVEAGYTDIVGVRSTDGGQSWSFPTYNPRQNTIYTIAKNISNDTLYAASSSIHDIYQSTHLTDASIDSGTGALLFSTDNGATWNTLHNFNHPVIWVAVDPTDPNRAYASVVNSTSGGIYTTTNLSAGASSTWTKVTNPPRTEGHPFDIRVLNDGSLVVSYSGHRNPGFTASSGVFFSSDHGNTWSDRTLIGASGQPGMQYWTKDITIDPTDPSQNTWWAAVRSGFGGNGNDMGGLYKTTDRGLHWTRVFSTDSVESVTINAVTKEMYVATLDSGVWYAPDATAASLSLTQTNYPFRQPERIVINPFNTNEVWVASFGYGLAVGLESAPPKVNSASFNFQTTQSVTLQFSADVSATFSDADITLANTTTNAMFSAHVANNGVNATITFPGNTPLPDGNYLLTLIASGISNSAGQLDGNGDGVGGDNYTFGFFVLAGDADRNKVVNTSDFVLMSQNFGKTGATFGQGDFNYDGVVNALDFNALATNFAKSLPAPPLAGALFEENRFTYPENAVLA